MTTLAAPVATAIAAEFTGNRDLGVTVHAERDHAVHIGCREPGVIEGCAGRFHGKLELAATGVLGELGGPDPGDRCRATEHRRPADHSCSRRASRTVPVTWLPSLQVPVTATTRSPAARPAPVSVSPPSVPVTRPANVSVSPA